MLRRFVCETGVSIGDRPSLAEATSGERTFGSPGRAAPAPVAAQWWRALAILAALMGFASISTDLHLPAMPTMGRALGAGTGAMELTASGFLVGFSLGQLMWGPIGDRLGRRRPVAVGLALFVIGSAGCALVGGAGAMIAWRIAQAVDASAAPWRATCRRGRAPPQ